MSQKNISITVDEELVGLMEERGIKLEDIERVIVQSEEAGDFLYDADEDKYLAKKRFGEFTVYAGYTKLAEMYMLHNAYGHRVQLESETE